MADKFDFGDVVKIDGEDEDFFLIGLSHSEATIVSKNDSWSEDTFGYTIRHVSIDKVQLA